MTARRDTRRVPEPSETLGPSWHGILTHTLRLQRCRWCLTHFLYRQAVCPFCLSEHLEWVSRPPNWAGVICRVSATRPASG